MWECNWILFMQGWSCSIRLIHLIGRKSLHFEKTSIMAVFLSGQGTRQLRDLGLLMLSSTFSYISSHTVFDYLSFIHNKCSWVNMRYWKISHTCISHLIHYIILAVSCMFIFQYYFSWIFCYKYTQPQSNQWPFMTCKFILLDFWYISNNIIFWKKLINTKTDN